MEEKVLQLTDQKIAEVLRVTFPQMDRYLYSKTKHSPVTGVQLVPLAQEIVNGLIFGETSKLRLKRKERPDMRKCTIRIPAEVLGRLQQQMSAFGVNELNAIVNMMICRGLEVEEHAREVG